MGLPIGLLIGLMAELSSRLFRPLLDLERLFGLCFAVVCALLGQGILAGLQPLLLPLTPLIEAWWMALVVVLNLLAASLILWLVPIFVDRTPLARVLEPTGLGKLYGALILFATLFSLAPGQLSSPGDQAPDRPRALAPEGSRDVILIVVDGLRADALGAYGSSDGLTPSLDSFAIESVRFERVISPAPVSGPAMASVMTGMLPTAHGCTEPGCRLSEGLTTLAEMLREHGYATGMIANHPDTFELSGFDQGFDYYVENLPSPAFEGSWSADRLLWMSRLHRVWERHRSSQREVGSYYRSADQVFLQLQELLSANRDRGNRFFSVVHLMETHSPLFEWKDGRTTGRAHGPIWSGRSSELDGEAIRSVYADEVVAVDREIGRFLDWLEGEEGFEETVVVVVGLQGQALGEHGVYWEGASVYDESVWVPLIMRLPEGELAGMEAAWQVRLQDLPVTLGVLAGATHPTSWQGQDLLDGRARDGLRGEMEEGESPLDRPAITELDLEDRRLQAVRTAEWSYIRTCAPESSLDRGRSACSPVEEGALEELYRHSLDPRQETNMVGQQGQLQSDLGVLLREGLEDSERVATERSELMAAISGCGDCQAMEAEGRILDCSTFCGDD
jgi:arylsulfatase A-like enzyme